MKISFSIAILFLLALIGETSSAATEATKDVDRISNAGQKKHGGFDESIPEASPLNDLDNVDESVLPSMDPDPHVSPSKFPLPTRRPRKPVRKPEVIASGVQDIQPDPQNPCGPQKQEFEKAMQDKEIYLSLFSRAAKELGEARKTRERSRNALLFRWEAKKRADRKVNRLQGSLKFAQVNGYTSRLKSLRRRLRNARRIRDKRSEGFEQEKIRFERAVFNEIRKARGEGSAEDALEMAKDKLVVQRRTYLQCKRRQR